MSCTESESELTMKVNVTPDGDESLMTWGVTVSDNFEKENRIKWVLPLSWVESRVVCFVRERDSMVTMKVEKRGRNRWTVRELFFSFLFWSLRSKRLEKLLCCLSPFYRFLLLLSVRREERRENEMRFSLPLEEVSLFREKNSLRSLVETHSVFLLQKKESKRRRWSWGKDALLTSEEIFVLQDKKENQANKRRVTVREKTENERADDSWREIQTRSGDTSREKGSVFCFLVETQVQD